MNLLFNKKIIVTGANGFIGSNLIDFLLGEGAIVYATSKNGEITKKLENSKKKLTIIKWDLANDEFPNIDDEIDFIFHLAAQTSHTNSMIDPINDIKVNLIATISLLNKYKHKNTKIIFTSTKGVTGKPEHIPINESTPTNPLDVYSANKLNCENYFKIYHRHYGLNYSILRVTNVYGPKQQITSPSKGILNYFIGQAIKNDVIYIYGDGSQLRDYTYISDCIDALIKLAISDKANCEIFYLGSGIGTKFIDMAKLIVKITGSGKIVFKEYPESAKNIEIGDFVVDNTKLKKLLNWEPKVNLEEGLKLTINYYKKNEKYYR